MHYSRTDLAFMLYTYLAHLRRARRTHLLFMVWALVVASTGVSVHPYYYARLAYAVYQLKLVWAFMLIGAMDAWPRYGALVAAVVEVCNLWPRRSKSRVYYTYMIQLWALTRVVLVAILIIASIPYLDRKGLGLVLIMTLVQLRFAGHLGVMCHTLNESKAIRATGSCGQLKRLQAEVKADRNRRARSRIDTIDEDDEDDENDDKLIRTEAERDAPVLPEEESMCEKMAKW